MGAITLDEYRKRLKENKKNTQNNNLGSDSNQKVTVPNTISYSNYKSKYSPKLSNEATITGNSILLPTITTNNTQQKDEQYLDTGKTYGDYWYQEYSTRKDDKIYSKGGKYYVFNSRTGDYQDVDKISYMTNADVDAKQLEEAQKNGYKGNKADLIKISNKILLDTGDLTKKEYAEYAKDLKRQEEKLNNEQKEKTKIRYSGTGIDAVKQIGSNVSDLAYSANKEIINPIVNFNDNYNIGKQNNELALEYYKKMEGKKNNAEQLEQKINKFNRYNKDLITNPGAAGSAIQNLNTQVESFKKQGLATIAGGTIGGIIGGTSGALAGGVGAIPGAISGAKTGATIGYTFGGVPYTYKLEAGNQYKELVSAGIPEKIAKDVSRKTGAINAAIESGENIVDIITLGQAGKLTGVVQQELYDQLEKAYGKKALKTLVIKTGYSYGQNILSESMEEMSQEGTSIHYEKEAFKKAGIDRNVTTEEDIDRVLEAGKSAAISTAFTAPITSLGGSIVTNVVNNLQIKANNRINTISKTEINDEIKKQVINYNNQNSTNLSADEILSIQKQVNNNLEKNNVTIVDNKTEKTLPTVYDIVAQEKNSATVLHENNPGLNTSKTDSGTSSIANNNTNIIKNQDNLNIKKAEDVVSNDIMSNDINVQDDTSVAFRENNITQSNGSVNAPINQNDLGKNSNNYFPTINTNTQSIGKYKIKNLNNHNEVIPKVIDFLKNSYLSTETQSKPIKNIATGMEIEIRQSGIRETFGNPKYYDKLSLEMKKAKISTMEHLAKMIKYGVVRSQEAPNYHNKNSKVTYAYLKHPINIDGKNYLVNIDIRKSPKGENRFYIHSLELKKETDLSSSQSKLLMDKSISSDNNIPQINKNVKLPIVNTNDMQNNENNTNKINLPTEKNTLGYIPQDPTRESSYNDDNNSKNTYRETVKKITIEDKIEKAIRNNSYKSTNYATKSVQDYLEFNRNEKKSFKDKISKYAKMTKEDLINPKIFNELKSIVDEYANKEINFVDEDLKNIKNEIRGTRIRIPDTVKSSINDYNGFRKNKFGKLRLSNFGESIDVIWQDLTERYPQYFDSNITGEEDILNELSTFMDKDIVFTEKYRIEDVELNRATTKLFNKLIQESFSNSDIEEMQKELEERASRRTRQVVREELLTEMGITIDDLTNSKDIQAPNFQITDPIRVNEKVFGREIGKKINEATIERTKHNTAEKIRWLNQERKDIKDLGIKPRSKESAAVQKYGEKQYLNQYGEMVDYTDHDLATEFPNAATQIKIKKAAEVIRKKYDNYIDQINDVLLDMGYDAIPKRNDYMRHFEELGDIFSQTGVPFNLNDMSTEDLPTDINGLTEFNRPGKNWFANAQKRTGEKTSYDAITGIDIYLEGAGNLIFHTEDIQRYRAFAKMIRDTYGKTNGWDNIGDLTGKELDNRIKDIQDNKLSKYAAWLDEQANSLAGKKGAIDRGTERILGRKGYTFLNTIKKQVGSNMVGFNIGSSLTNLISSTFASSKTNKIAFVKGTISTIQNMIHNDGFIEKSDFLTSRFGSNQLSTKLWQKSSNAGQVFMTGTDYLTANQIVRSKYFEGLSKGMSEQNAINYADDFASRVMGDRSQGATPEIFNSKTLGLFTQFQLEVNNQWQYMIHDTKMDFQYNSSINGGLKAGATVLFQLGQLAAYSYFFNELFESLTGRRPAFDPIEILKTLFGIGDDEDDEEKSFDERCEKAKEMLIEQLPFASILTNGGRIPISEALPITELVSGEDKFGNKKSRLDIIKEALPYYILPGGYGQIKKGISGAKMYDKSLPVAGSYTDSGNLRFTVDDDITSKFKSFLFGQYSSKEAQDYIDSGFKTISANNIDEMKDLGMTSSQYRSLKNKISAISKTTDENGYQKYTDNSNNIYWYDKNNKVVYDSNYNKVNKSITKFEKVNSNEQAIEYIVNSNLTKNQKNILINNMLKRENLDSYGFQKYTGEEYDNKKGEYVEKTYWYDKENNILYDSDYNEVNNNILGRLNKVNSIKYNSDDYKKYDSYEEYIYANQNKEKYNWLKDNNISYATYTKSKENKKIYNYAYNNQNIYNLSKVITNDFEKYYKIQQEINDIESNYYSNGKEVPNSRKNKVIKYINSLNLSIPQKALLIKMEYSSYKKYDNQIIQYVNSQNIGFLEKASILKKAGFTSYDKQIINYVNKMNISKAEKEEILEEMGFTIRNGRVYS